MSLGLLTRLGLSCSGRCALRFGLASGGSAGLKFRRFGPAAAPAAESARVGEKTDVARVGLPAGLAF